MALSVIIQVISTNLFSIQFHVIDLLVNVKDLNLAQQAELNCGGVKYGLAVGDFMRHLNAELREKEEMRLAKIQEEEKQAMSVSHERNLNYFFSVVQCSQCFIPL